MLSFIRCTFDTAKMEDKKTGIIEFNVFHGARLFINDLHRVFIGNPVVYSIYRLIDHAFRDFCIDLSGRDMLVSEHLAQGDKLSFHPLPKH